MKWYVLQVNTGKELEVRTALQKERIPAKVPQEALPFRCKGVWEYRATVLFPGYVFIGADELGAELYYTAKGVPGFVKFLGSPKPQALTYLDAEQVQLLAPTDEPLQPSTYVLEGDELKVTAGTLLRFAPACIKFDKRRRRAKVTLELMGEAKEIELSLRPEDEVPEEEGDADEEETAEN